MEEKTRIKSTTTLVVNFSFVKAVQNLAMDNRENSRRPLVMAVGQERALRLRQRGKSQGLVFSLFSCALIPRQSHSSGSSSASGSSGALKPLKLRKGNLTDRSHEKIDFKLLARQGYLTSFRMVKDGFGKKDFSRDLMSRS